MDIFFRPVIDFFERTGNFGKYPTSKRNVGFQFFIAEKFCVVIAELVKERYEFGNLRKHGYSRLSKPDDFCIVVPAACRNGLFQIGRGKLNEFVFGKFFDVFRIQPAKFIFVENRVGMGNARDVESFGHFLHCHFFAVVLGCPPQKRYIIQYGFL